MLTKINPESLEQQLGAAKWPIVQFFVNDYNLIVDLDDQIDEATATGNAFMRELAENNADAVAQANAIKEQINALAPAARAVVIESLVSDSSLRKFLREYLAANAPKAETTNVNVELVAKLWNDRADAQKRCVSLYSAFKQGTLTESELALIPEPPEGKRGAAPGVKRGQMGRKLPKNVSWIIDNEECGILKGTDAAKRIGVKVADLRQAIEAKYADATPDNFEVRLNEKQVVGNVVRDAANEVEEEELENEELEFDAFDTDADNS